jgi:hypothetical protein
MTGQDDAALSTGDRWCCAAVFGSFWACLTLGLVWMIVARVPPWLYFPLCLPGSWYGATCLLAAVRAAMGRPGF